MVEPEDVRHAVAVDGQRVPAAVAGGARGLQRRRRPEVAAAVGGPGDLDLGALILGVPGDDDVRRGCPSALMQGDARRDLAADPGVAGHAVHLHRSPERRALVVADRHARCPTRCPQPPPTPPRRRGRASRPTASSCCAQAPTRSSSQASEQAPGRRAQSARHPRARVAVLHPSHFLLQASRPSQKGSDPKSSRGQNVVRPRSEPEAHRELPRCAGRPTAVTWLKVADGLVGYAPVPKLVLRAISFTALVRLNTSASASSAHRAGEPERPAERAGSAVKNSSPTPELRGDELAVHDRPARPCPGWSSRPR